MCRPARPPNAVVRWPSSGGLDWRGDVRNLAPDLSAAFAQLLAAQGGLAAGAHVQIWARGDPDTGNAEVRVWDRNLGPENVATLSIETCE